MCMLLIGKIHAQLQRVHQELLKQLLLDLLNLCFHLVFPTLKIRVIGP